AYSCRCAAEENRHKDAAGRYRRNAGAIGKRWRFHAPASRRRPLLMLYLDTSLLVAALSTEAKKHEVQAWLTAQDPARLAISNWVVSEFSAALSVKLRTAQITPAFRANMLAAFNELAEHSL